MRNMRALMWMLLAAAYVLAEDKGKKRIKVPYIADAVGNTLPPPSSGPAPVGSPVNLLTPDRYEFYTFDESGELVKRLMTLEEIQAIVAAGEETEGLVTIANENQPTIAFNFSQPSYNKVHSVVTNVQNVLKAQMEAHKNKPPTQPTLDTPDVSDSWSLILPSIFGNTGVDITPDKTSGTFTTPDTETFELDRPIDNNSLSKEGSNQIISSTSTKADEELKKAIVTEKMTSVSYTTDQTKVTERVSSTTKKPIVTITTAPKTTTTLPTTTSAKTKSTVESVTASKITSANKVTTPAKPFTTTSKPTSTSSKPSTTKLRTTTSTTTTTTTTSRPRTTTTSKPRTTTTSKPTTKFVQTTPKPTTVQSNFTTTKKTSTTQKEPETNFTRIHTFTNTPSASEKTTVQYEKISTFVPFSTAAYVTERSTQIPVQSTRAPTVSSTNRYLPTTTKKPQTTIKAKPSITTYKPSTTIVAFSMTPKDAVEKFNATTITTQSVSPSTTVSSTEFVNGHFSPTEKNSLPNNENANDIKQEIPENPLFGFDVAQSFSQIASDLGGEYQPIPTTSDLLDTTKLNDMTLESKENIEIDIPADVQKPTKDELQSKEEKPVDNKKPNTVTESSTDLKNSSEIEKHEEHNNITEKEQLTDVKRLNVAENYTEANNESDVNQNSKIEKPVTTISSLPNPIDLQKTHEQFMQTKNPDEVRKPIEKLTEKNKTSEVDNPGKIQKPAYVKKPANNSEKIKKPIKDGSTDIMNNSDNFVKISTIDPHNQNENHVFTKENLQTETKTTQESTPKIEPTTSAPVVGTTIDAILSESMDDLLSQIVNQAPQSIIETKDQPVSVNQKVTTSSPKLSMKEIETSTKMTTIHLEKQPVKVVEKVSQPQNTTNEIVLLTIKPSELDQADKKPPLTNKVDEQIKIGNTPTPNTLANKQNLVKISESSSQIKEDIESTSTNTTLLVEIDKNITEENKKNHTSINVTSDDAHNISIKIEPTITTTVTEISPKLNLSALTNNSVKIPETVSSNKEISEDKNKISNPKLSEKVSEEEHLPKVDEFKKKIQKVNIDDKELVNDRNNSWKLISTVSPPKANEIPKDKVKPENQVNADKNIVLDVSKENQGLEVTTKDLGEDIAQFTELCNELAFRYWYCITESIDKRRSFILSPYSITSMLGMIFMGAKGATSGEMNEILKLDDMVTFNPHFTLKNISDSIETTPSSGVIVSAFVRELFSDRSKGKILTFYKERAQHFYNGHVEEVNFKLISDIIRRRTNLLVKRYTWGRIVEYMKSNTITLQPPLAAFSANIFQTDCSGSSVEGRDGEMYFVVSPNVRQRRLVPVPAVVYRNGFLAGYDPALDATAAALGNTNSIISTLFLMPGQQGNVVHAEDLEALEKRLLDSNPTTPAWNRLLRTLLPRMGLELQIPRFLHKSIFNISTTLQKMGLKELFDSEHADLGGLNGPSKDLYLSDMVQSTTFVTCGEGVIAEQHHIEEYPEHLNGPQRRRTSRWVSGWDEPRDYQRAFHDPHDVGEAMNLPLHLRPRQARVPARNTQPARLKFDRPFLYFVRHNPTGMILYVGRYNPRLLP